MSQTVCTSLPISALEIRFKSLSIHTAQQDIEGCFYLSTKGNFMQKLPTYIRMENIKNPEYY